MMIRHTLAGAAVLLLVGASTPVLAQEAAEGGDAFTVDEALAERGEQLFQRKACVGCHTIGDGVFIGPDLDGVVARRDLDWLGRMIAQPEQMTANDSLAKALLEEYDGIQMPNPQDLSDEGVEALIHYIASQSSDGG